MLLHCFSFEITLVLKFLLLMGVRDVPRFVSFILYKSNAFSWCLGKFFLLLYDLLSYELHDTFNEEMNQINRSPFLMIES